MISFITDRIDKYLGRGRYSIAVPVMDGPLHPNNRLDEAKQVIAHEGIDNVVAIDGDILFSSGSSLLQLSAKAKKPKKVSDHEAPITFLAADEAGALAIGLDGKGIVIQGGSHDGKRVESLGGSPLLCSTSAVFANSDKLVVTIGARDRLQADWKRDLMASGKSGSVWEINLASGESRQLASGLAWPCGVCRCGNGFVVSEAWEHRLVLIEGAGTPFEVLGDLPGYPSRIVSMPNGGYALAVFAPRNQLVEFVLREPEFLHAMVSQVHPDNWIAPKLKWGQGFKEPMQGAALKTMGIIKPWAPTWSYGLVIALDDAFQPTSSFHSRADGSRHGVTSVCMLGNEIIAAARGAGVAVSLSPANTAEAK